MLGAGGLGDGGEDVAKFAVECGSFRASSHAVKEDSDFSAKLAAAFDVRALGEDCGSLRGVHLEICFHLRAGRG